MLVDNFLARPLGNGEITVSWTSNTTDTWSWIFLNGKLVAGPYMAETRYRSVTIPASIDATFIIEIHDFEDETVPDSIVQKPLIRPQIAWNCVDTAMGYHVYHTIFDTGTIETLLLATPPMGFERMEIDCPMKLEGRGGRWHSFRVEAVDQFGNESQNNIVPHFAADLPPVPELSVSRNVETGKLTFRLET